MLLDAWRSVKPLVYRLRYALGRRLEDKRYILQLTDRTKLPDSVLSPEVEVHSYVQTDALPEGLIAEIATTMKAPNYRRGLDKQFAAGARLCVVTVGGRFGALGWTRAGRDIPKWHVELEPEDVVFSRAFTAPQMRGRRLYPIVLAASCREPAPCRYFADCHVHNLSSLNALKRNGWSIVDMVRVS